jgi:pimeloyl-ACP methyl ester carboxylesterase
MHRRILLFAAIAALLVTACTSTAPRAFTSDRISVTTRGTGRDVILIHGLGGHRDQWSGVAESLDDRYRLHLVQMNGFAGVPAPTAAGETVAAPAAEEIARYITETGLDRPAVIGHSMGGSIGMMLAARHPQLVGRLMVVDMIPFMGQMFGATNSESARPTADQFRTRLLSEPAGEGTLTQMFRTMTTKEEMVPTLLQQARTSDPRTVANSFHELIVADLRPELPRITAPVTVLYVIPPNAPMPPDQYDAMMRAAYAPLPAGRILKIDDSRHFIHWDQPARFLSEVDAFLTR